MVTYTWGNVSGIDRSQGIVAIKPSGVEYNVMRAEDIVLLDLAGKVVEGKLKPSSDAPTHLALYGAFKDIGGNSAPHPFALGDLVGPGGIGNSGLWHDARRLFLPGEIHLQIPGELTREEIEGTYELNTGHVIIDTFKGIDPNQMQGVLVRNHAPFTWGKDADDATFIIPSCWRKWP